MNRVTLVLASSTGGVGAHVRSLALRLPRLGWEVTVVGPVATDAGFGFTAIGARFVATAGRLDLGAVRRSAGDVVHAHGLRAGVLVGLGPGPRVVTWHNAVLAAEHRRAARLFLAAGEMFVARRADVTLTASADLAARARSLGARDVREVAVAPEPLPPTRTRAQMRAALGVTQERVVLTVARLHPQKALDVLVDAAPAWPATVVLVAGDGPLHAQLQAHIDRAAAPVRLLGTRRDVADLLQAADVAVLPSRWEARSLFAQEALRAGLPLVATDVGGLSELLGAGAALVPAGDVGALASAVGRLLADPAALAALGAAGTARAQDWPTAADTAAAVAAVYRELLP